MWPPTRSILCPILFSIYINDLPNCLLQAKILLYADDAVLFYADSNIGNISTVLNKDLKQLQSWTHLNNLCIHPVKTEYVLFGTQQRIASATLSDGPFSLFLGDKPINQAQHYKYLGVLLDSNLNFKQLVDKLLVKISKRIGVLGRIRNNLTVDAANKVYQSLVLPVMDYCDVAWSSIGKIERDKLDRAQRRAARIVLKTKDSDAEKNLKWLPLSMRRDMHTINLTFKCLKGSPPMFFKDYFKVFRTIHNTRGSGQNLLLPKVRTEMARKSFYFNGSKLFNHIASEMKDSKSVVIFKTRTFLELYRSKVF